MTQTVLKSNHALRDARTGQGLSLRELAFFANVSHSTIARLERGDLDVSAAIKARLARALGKRPEQLWSGEDE
jgi:transcriptional regulator with XRE-family HTH domain